MLSSVIGCFDIAFEYIYKYEDLRNIFTPLLRIVIKITDIGLLGTVIFFVS